MTVAKKIGAVPHVVPSKGRMKGQAPGYTVDETAKKSSIHRQLYKTRFCLYHLQGVCQFGSECVFAHSCEEIQGAPDLRKTWLCPAFVAGSCKDSNCRFAHDEAELRSTDMFFKKVLCVWHEKGRCRNGDQCRFAHGQGELKANGGQDGTKPFSRSTISQGHDSQQWQQQQQQHQAIPCQIRRGKLRHPSCWQLAEFTQHCSHCG
mmetsp:Transcript_2241/g.5314  ORF Transcript_2241/g.5314 Transcript_2241/m.5314 type:complete len:205 (+) Transcript_2241:93-707(+)